MIVPMEWMSWFAVLQMVKNFEMNTFTDRSDTCKGGRPDAKRGPLTFLRSEKDALKKAC